MTTTTTFKKKVAFHQPSMTINLLSSQGSEAKLQDIIYAGTSGKHTRSEEEIERNGKRKERAKEQSFQAGRRFTVQENANEGYEPPRRAPRRTE